MSLTDTKTKILSFDDKYLVHASHMMVDMRKLMRLRDNIGENSLEEWLTAYWEEMKFAVSKEFKEMHEKQLGDICLYLWRLMVGVSGTYRSDNSYAVLLNKIAHENREVENAYINFNYDLLFDRAYNDIFGNFLTNTLESYTTRNYLKPHGSVNWFISSRPGVPAPQPIREKFIRPEVALPHIATYYFKGEPLDTDTRFEILNPSDPNLFKVDTLYSRISTSSLTRFRYPLILLPLTSKMYDHVGNFIRRMTAEYERIFSSAKDIFVIGYRANDEMFNKMIAKAPQGTRLHTVGRSNAPKLHEELLKRHSNLISGDIYSDGFENFANSFNQGNS